MEEREPEGTAPETAPDIEDVSLSEEDVRDPDTDESTEEGEAAPEAPKPGLLTNERVRLLGLIAAVIGIVVIAYGAWRLFLNQEQIPPGLPPEAEAAPLTVTEPTPEEVASAEPVEEAIEPADESVAIAPAEAEPYTVEEAVEEPPAEETPAPAPPQKSTPPKRAPNRSSASTETVTAGVVAVKPVAPLTPEPSALEQLMMQRRMAQQMRMMPDGSPAKIRVADPRSVELAFSTADREFVRTLIEEAADIPSRFDAKRWQTVQKAPTYPRVLLNVYDYILTTEEKLDLLAAYASAKGLPASTPPLLRRLELPPRDLAQVRDRIWKLHGDDIVRLINAQ